MKTRTCVSACVSRVCAGARVLFSVSAECIICVRARRDRGGCVSQAPLQHAAAWEVARAPVRVTTAKKPVRVVPAGRAAVARYIRMEWSVGHHRRRRRAQSSCTFVPPPRRRRRRRRALSRSPHTVPPPVDRRPCQYAANTARRIVLTRRCLLVVVVVAVIISFVYFFFGNFFHPPFSVHPSCRRRLTGCTAFPVRTSVIRRPLPSPSPDPENAAPLVRNRSGVVFRLVIVAPVTLRPRSFRRPRQSPCAPPSAPDDRTLVAARVRVKCSWSVRASSPVALHPQTDPLGRRRSRRDTRFKVNEKARA